jgi:hypothetical protein
VGDDHDSLLVLTAALNSTLISLFYKERAVKGARKVFPKIVIKNLREFPFPHSVGRGQRDKIVNLVERMHTLHERKAVERNPEALRHLDAEIATTNGRIDHAIYELYHLTQDEIGVVGRGLAAG